MTEWISVEEELPLNGETVLLLVNSCWPDPYTDRVIIENSSKIFTGRFSRCSGWDIYFCPVIRRRVTHWMPLPEAPNGKDKGLE